MADLLFDHRGEFGTRDRPARIHGRPKEPKAAVFGHFEAAAADRDLGGLLLGRARRSDALTVGGPTGFGMGTLFEVFHVALAQLVALQAVVLGNLLPVLAPLAVLRLLVFAQVVEVLMLQSRAAGPDHAAVVDEYPGATAHGFPAGRVAARLSEALAHLPVTLGTGRVGLFVGIAWDVFLRVVGRQFLVGDRPTRVTVVDPLPELREGKLGDVPQTAPAGLVGGEIAPLGLLDSREAEHDLVFVKRVRPRIALVDHVGPLGGQVGPEEDVDVVAVRFGIRPQDIAVVVGHLH